MLYSGDQVFDRDETTFLQSVPIESSAARMIQPPTFANENDEVTWWASRQGREFLK